MIKIGDRVRRIKGRHASGMDVGDRATVTKIVYHFGEKYVALKEYPGVHIIDSFEKEWMFNTSKDDVFYDSEKIARFIYDEIYKEDIKRKISKQHILNKYSDSDKIKSLKKQRDDIDKKIAELENKEVKLDNSYAENIFNKYQNVMVEANLYKKGNAITCLLSHPVTKRTLGKGISKCCPNDKFDINTGVEIAYHRAIMSYNNRRVHELIRNTY